MKRLYRSDEDRKLAGVCGGIAIYFDVDPVAVRLMWALLTIFSGIVPGILAYIVAMLIMPTESTVLAPHGDKAKHGNLGYEGR